MLVGHSARLVLNISTQAANRFLFIEPGKASSRSKRFRWMSLPLERFARIASKFFVSPLRRISLRHSSGIFFPRILLNPAAKLAFSSGLEGTERSEERRVGKELRCEGVR